MATPSLETKIWLALRGHLETLMLPSPVPIIWPGETGALPTGTSLEVKYLPNRPDRVLIGSTAPHARRGILQIGVLTQTGSIGALEIAGDVAAHFPTDSRMAYQDVTARIYEAPTVGSAFRDTERSRYITPVTVRYEVYA